MRKKRLVIAGLIAGVLLIGGAFAYFSSRAVTKENKFNIAVGGTEDGEIKIIEEKWDDPERDKDKNDIPDDAEDIEPGQEIIKDPHVKSEVEYDGFVIMKVSIPTVKAELGQAEFENPGIHDTFLLQKLNERDFVKLGEEVVTEEAPEGESQKKSVYYYGYKKVVPAKGETTNLFEQVRMQDFAIIGKVLNDSIDLDAIIVQKINPTTGVLFGTEFKEDGTTVWHEEDGAAEAFALVKNF